MSFCAPRTGSTQCHRRGMHYSDEFQPICACARRFVLAELLPEHHLNYVRNQGTYLPALGWVNCIIDERLRGFGCGCGSPVFRHRYFSEEFIASTVMVILVYRPPNVSRFQFHTIPSCVHRCPTEHSRHVTSATLVQLHVLGGEKFGVTL